MDLSPSSRQGTERRSLFFSNGKYPCGVEVGIAGEVIRTKRPCSREDALPKREGGGPGGLSRTSEKRRGRTGILRCLMAAVPEFFGREKNQVTVIRTPGGSLAGKNREDGSGSVSVIEAFYQPCYLIPHLLSLVHCIGIVKNCSRMITGTLDAPQ